ncbi:MAG: tetratricopeptide repeat protein [Pseudomonadota bacterium]
MHVRVSYRREGADEVQAYGEAVPFVSPISVEDLTDYRWYLERYLVAPFAQYAERGAAIEVKLRDWGEALFGTLFGPGLSGRDAYLQARERCAELVVRSAAAREAASFLSLPWELLADPDRPTPLALDLAGISRSCQVTGPLIKVPGGDSLRVLMVIARPSGLDDVDFQMVARPLHDRLAIVPGKVRLDVARPPTLAALEAQLTAAIDSGAPYHAVHFDGHGAFAEGAPPAAGMFDHDGTGGAGFLLFETVEGGEHLAPAGDFAQVMKRAQVPLVVLNACQSAMLGEQATTGATVATRLLEEGVRSVVAMSHSVYAVAASEFMAAFYEALFRGESVLAAVTAGRRQLRRKPERPSPKGDTALQDWAVPVLYARADMTFPGLTAQPVSAAGPDFGAMLDRMRKGQTEAAAQGAAALEGIEAEAGIFVGRSAEFYRLELAARHDRAVLIEGPAGTGKTELAKGFARWWRDTGGTDNPGHVFFNSFEPGLASFGLDGVLSAIAREIIPTEHLARIRPEELRPILVDALRAHAMLLVWDNFESVYTMADPASPAPPLDAAARAEIAGFLAEVAAPGGRSVVLITSRNPEDWLGRVRRMSLGGLLPQDAADYASKVLAPHAIGRTRPAADRQGYEALMRWLDGHPLSMKLILPHLEAHSARALLEGLQGQGALPAGFAGEGRTQGLAASLLWSLDHLDADTRAMLPALSLFEGVVDADVLMIMSEQEDTPVRFARIDRARWSAALDQAEELGLLAALGSGVYRLHPALPAMLAAEWRAAAGDDYGAEREAAATALITAHATFGRWLDRQIEGGEAELAHGLLALQRRTFGWMAKAAFAAGQYNHAHNMLQPLFAHLNARGEVRETTAWIDHCLDALETAGGEAPDFESAAGALWLFVKCWSANLATDAHDLNRAEAIYDGICQTLKAAPKSEARDRHLAIIYHQFGIVAQHRGALDAAEDWYKKSLAIEEALGNRPGMASSYHELGIVAQHRGALDAAGDWYKKSLAIEEALGNRPGMASSYHQLGIVAQLRGALDAAEDWYKKSLAIKEALGNRPGMASSYHQLGMVAQHRGALDAAEDWYKKSLAIQEALGNRPGMASSYHQLGIVAQLRGALDAAEDWYKKSLAIEEALGNRPGMASSYQQLGLLAEARGYPPEALKWTIRCLKLFEEFGQPATGPAPQHLVRLTHAHGEAMFAEAWQAVTGDTVPEALMTAIRDAKEEDTS